VNAKRERVKLKNEVFAPGENVSDRLPAKPLDANPAVAGDGSHLSAHKRAKLLGGEVD